MAKLFTLVSARGPVLGLCLRQEGRMPALHLPKALLPNYTKRFSLVKLRSVI